MAAFLATTGYLDEKRVIYIIWQLLSVIRYLHSKLIVHRDIRLETLFIY
jgi:serine/threonine protein kinase